MEEHAIRFEPLIICDDEWFSLMCGYYAKSISVSDDIIYCVTAHDGSLIYTLTKEKYDVCQRTYIRKYGFFMQHLTADELHILGLDFMPLYMLYNTVISGYGLKNAITYWRLLRKEGVPLVVWKNVQMKDLFARAIRSLMKRVFGESK